MLFGRLKTKANLEHKRCADGHENYFDITTASMLKLSYDSKSYGVKNPTFYVLLHTVFQNDTFKMYGQQS